MEQEQKEHIRTVVRTHYFRLRHVILNILKADTVENWNATMPTSTIDEVTNIIHRSFGQHGQLRREDDIHKLANLYYAGYTRAILHKVQEPIKKPA